MDRTAALFWGLIVLLLSASVFYGFNAEKQRRGAQNAGGKIDNGDLVQLIKVVDGDSVMAAREGQEPVTVRLIGIKSFDGKIEKDVVTPFAQAARESLQRIMTGRSARVLLGSTPKDKYGRYLATLYSGDKDVALHLVSQGLVMVYTVYPFPAMQLYLQEQELARAGRRGLWASAEASDRALALISEWQRQTQ